MRVFGKAALAALAVLACVPVWSGNAWASPGCTAFHGSYNNGAVSGSTNGTQFNRGDVITFTVSDPRGVNIGLVDYTTFTVLIPPGGVNFTYTVPADTPDKIGLAGAQNAPDAAVFSCQPAASGTGLTNSQILEQTRQTFSRVGASASSQAISDSTSDAISDAFSGTGTTSFSSSGFRTNFAALEKADTDTPTKNDPFASFDALGYAKAPYHKAPPPQLQSPWYVWIDARYTGFDDRSIASFDGWHDNVTAGASYRFTQNFLAGALVGYENFKYSMVTAGTPTSLGGNGVSGGGYFGWKFYDRMRLDGMLSYGHIDYGATAGPVAGSFGADRVTGMTKLSGRYGFNTFYFEPSATLIIASERQASFTDSAAVVHNNFNFVVGRASTGGTIATPIVWGSCIVTPTFGAFADYRFGDQNVAAVSVIPTFNNGSSGRVNGGFNVAMPHDVTASATGEYGGLGDEIRYWRAKASVGVKF